VSYRNEKGELVQCQPSWNIHDGHNFRTVTRTRRRVVYQGFSCIDCGKKSRNFVPVEKIGKGLFT
jgi:hypothetical protein